MPDQHTAPPGRRNGSPSLGAQSIGRVTFVRSRIELLVHVEKCKLGISTCGKGAGKLRLAAEELLEQVATAVPGEGGAGAVGSPRKRKPI